MVIGVTSIHLKEELLSINVQLLDQTMQNRASRSIHGVEQTSAAQPAVSSKANAATAMANKISAHTSTERFDISIKQFFICDSADIVLTEESLFEHKYQNSWTEQNSEPIQVLPEHFA